MSGIGEKYATSALMTLFGMNKMAVLRRAARENWQSRKRAGRGGGKEWLVSSMPPATVAALQLAEANIQHELGEEAAPAPAPVSALPAAPVPDWSFKVAKTRYRLVVEWRAYVEKAKAGGKTTKAASQAFVEAYNAGLLLEQLKEVVEELAVKTLYRWNKTLAEANEDLMALADRRGKWTDPTVPRGLGQIAEIAQDLFLQAYLQDRRPSMRTAFFSMEAALTQKDLPVPSYASVRRFFMRYDANHHDIVVLRREGEKALSDKVGPYLNRDDSILQVGDILVSDGHKMNCTMINPETGKPARFTLIGWQDWASRVFVSFEIMLTENTQAISASLHRAIVALGKKPKAVLIDNGKAFKNKFFEGKADLEEMDGLYLRLGIVPIHSKPYVGRTKIIERWWGDFDRQCAVWMESYTGPNIDKKPAHLMRNEKWQQAQQSGHVPTIEEVKEVIIKYARWKAMQPHPKRPGKTPWQVFEAGRGPGLSEDEKADLARQFMMRREITPKRCRFTFCGIDFESDELYGINKKLLAYYSLADMSEIYVYDAERFVTVARPVASVHPMAKLFGTGEDARLVAEANKRQARLKAQTRRLAEEIGGAGAEVLTRLPYMQRSQDRKETIPAALDNGQETKALAEGGQCSDEQARKIKRALEEARAKMAAAPTYSTPGFFESELDKYTFFFDLAERQGIELKPEDAEFMRRYEASEEYQVTGLRFEKLRQLYHNHNQAQQETA